MAEHLSVLRDRLNWRYHADGSLKSIWLVPRNGVSEYWVEMGRFIYNVLFLYGFDMISIILGL